MLLMQSFIIRTEYRLNDMLIRPVNNLHLAKTEIPDIVMATIIVISGGHPNLSKI